ncbi:hypothetical protein Pla8534_38750 [Lignipirellula cremea]|uniref:Uncharacterized protein n=1 Tax=Lignipirellula cremea TaxID=2528010 RepID=A0A518DW43_9BACT|nr:hypothetical protein Pla8534_38750 [Lignipirellula cremea]
MDRPNRTQKATHSEAKESENQAHIGEPYRWSGRASNASVGKLARHFDKFKRAYLVHLRSVVFSGEINDYWDFRKYRVVHNFSCPARASPRRLSSAGNVQRLVGTIDSKKARRANKGEQKRSLTRASGW